MSNFTTWELELQQIVDKQPALRHERPVPLPRIDHVMNGPDRPPNAICWYTYSNQKHQSEPIITESGSCPIAQARQMLGQIVACTGINMFTVITYLDMAKSSKCDIDFHLSFDYGRQMLAIASYYSDSV